MSLPDLPDGWSSEIARPGYLPVNERAGLHSVEEVGEDQPMTDLGNKVVWFMKRSLRSVQKSVLQ
jgi:hypothetical protein